MYEAGDRHAHRGRLRALRSLELRPAGASLPAQRELLAGRAIFCRWARGGAVHRWPPRDESPQHDDLYPARCWPDNRQSPNPNSWRRRTPPANGLVFALRRLEGIDVEQFAAETGFSVMGLAGDVLPRLMNLGLMEIAAGHLKLTRPGLLVSDAIWPEFLRV